MKIVKSKLEREYEIMLDDKILKIIQEVLKANNKDFDISIDMDLKRLGLNSLTYIKVIVDIENELDIMFDDDELDIESFKTVGDFVERVKQICK